MSVVDDKMYYGLKKMISAVTNLQVFSEHDTVRGSEYVYVSLEDVETILPATSASTFVGTFNIDYVTNNKNQKAVRSNKSKLLEALADNTEYRGTTDTLYFNGEVQNIEQGEEEDSFEFRIAYEISHTKVS